MRQLTGLFAGAKRGLRGGGRTTGDGAIEIREGAPVALTVMGWPARRGCGTSGRGLNPCPDEDDGAVDTTWTKLSGVRDAEVTTDAPPAGVMEATVLVVVRGRLEGVINR